MVIKLKSKKKPPVVQAPPPNRFTLEQIEDLFKQSKDWGKFYKENENKLWESKIDIYGWPVYPLCIKDEYGFYRCILHTQPIEINCGPEMKPLTHFFKNINYAEFISHCIYHEPEKHKQYIIEKLFGRYRVSTTQ